VLHPKELGMIFDLFLDCFAEYTVRIVLFGAIILGATAGMLGSFVLLRQQSLLGDAIAHASLPGIVTMFLLTGTRNPALLMIGASLAGTCGIFFMHCILSTTRLKKDAVLGIILSVFFGIGLVLLTVVQKSALPHQAILNKFLFGSVATLLYTDIVVMLCASFIILALVFLFFKEFSLISFDTDFARVTGYPVTLLDGLLNFLLVCIITIGLQVVGVILISTMIIAPAAAARQWTSSLSTMVLLAGAFGASAAITGVIISSIVPHMPTGPCIIVAASSLVCFSLLAAPKRGMVAQWLRMRAHR
jgi:manganese/zinc/iron transport system permease protein